MFPVAFILTAQLLATTPQTTTAAPVVRAESGQTRTLADVARERKLGKKGVQGGTLSVAGVSSGTTLDEKIAYVQSQIVGNRPEAYDKAKDAASDEMWSTIKHTQWVRENINCRLCGGIRQNAENEWDAAAETCRKTPGCTPFYRK